MIKIRFPKVDANVVEGQIGTWLKHEGEAVAKDESLVELITDKANFELPSEAAGVLRKIVATEKSVVPVNYVIALLGAPDEALPDVSEENQNIMEEHRQEAAALNAAKAAAKSAGRPAMAKKKVRATPAARRVAREAGIDLADVPIGDGDKIVTEDHVKAYVAKNGGRS